MARPPDATAQRYVQAVSEARLGTIVEVPLLATIAALLFEHDQERPLPNSRTKLYAEFVRHLLVGRPTAIDQRKRIRAEFDRYGDPGQRSWSWFDQHLRELVEHLADKQLTSANARRGRRAGAARGWPRLRPNAV